MPESNPTPDLRRLQEFCVALAIEATPAAVAEALRRGLREISRAAAVVVALRDGRGGRGPLAHGGLTAEELEAVVVGLQRICADEAMTTPVAVAQMGAELHGAALPASLATAGLLVLPVAKGDCEKLGAAGLVFRTPLPKAETPVVQALGTLTSQAATALDNVWLQAELRERAERTEVLNAVARALAATADVERVFTRIADVTRRLLAFDMATLIRIVDDRAVLLAFEAEDYPGEVGVGTTVPIPEIYAELVAEPRARLLREIEASDHPSWQRMGQAGIRSAMAAPLVSGTEIPAVLVIGSRATEAYGDRDLSNLQALADQIAPAVESIVLQQALRESRALYETLLQAIPDPVTVTDLAGRITYATERAVRQHGAESVEDMIGRNAFEIIAPEYLEEAQRNAERTLREGHSGVVEYEVIGLDGERRPAELTAALVPGADGEPRGFIAITRDITARKRNERRVRAYQQQLRSLAAELSLAEERQRRRIAAELHDEISQTLVLVKLKLAALRGKAAADEAIDELRGIVDQTLGRVQALIWEISSPILAELGLDAALRWLAEKLSRSHGLDIQVRENPDDTEMAEDLQLVLFQAVRELLVNVAKHADSPAAEVSVRRRVDEIEIEVVDEGIGFDATDIGTDRAGAGGFGLFSIRERLSHLGGRMLIDSVPGIGTRVRLIAPLAGTG